MTRAEKQKITAALLTISNALEQITDTYPLHENPEDEKVDKKIRLGLRQILAGQINVVEALFFIDEETEK